MGLGNDERRQNMIAKEGLPAWLWRLAVSTLAQTGDNIFAPKRLRQESRPKDDIPFDSRGGIREFVFRLGRLIK